MACRARGAGKRRRVVRPRAVAAEAVFVEIGVREEGPGIGVARVAADGFWYRLSQFVMRFPGRIAVATATLLIVLGIPALGINFNAADVQVLPTSASARQVDGTLRADFQPYHDTPAVLAVSGGAEEGKRVAAAAEQLPGVAKVGPPTEVAGDL